MKTVLNRVKTHGLTEAQGLLLPSDYCCEGAKEGSVMLPRWSFFGAAAAGSTVACVLAARSGAMLSALFAATTPVLLLASTAAKRRRHPTAEATLLRKVADQVEVGRRLVIYERETGLLAMWYIALRCDEECYRARRYGHALTLISIAPTPESDAWAVQQSVADWLRQHLRKTDLAAYVGDGRYVVMMPETAAPGAQIVLDRLRADVDGVEIGVASSPDDADNFEQLLAAARSCLGGPRELAA